MIKKKRSIGVFEAGSQETRKVQRISPEHERLPRENGVSRRRAGSTRRMHGHDHKTLRHGGNRDRVFAQFSASLCFCGESPELPFGFRGVWIAPGCLASC